MRRGAADEPFEDYEDGDSPGDCSVVGLPKYVVHPRTRSLWVEDTELAYASPGHDPTFTRTYTPTPLRTGMFGDRWRLAYESDLLVEGSVAYVLRPSGRQVAFRGTQWVEGEAPPAGVVDLSPPTDVRLRLRWNGPASQFELLDLETRETWVYRASAALPDWPSLPRFRLVQVRDGFGNATTVGFGSGALADRIVTVTDAAGRTTTFDYDADGLAMRMTSPDGRTARYAYATSGAMRLLASTTDFLGTTTTLAYDADGVSDVLHLGRQDRCGDLRVAAQRRQGGLGSHRHRRPHDAVRPVGRRTGACGAAVRRRGGPPVPAGASDALP